MRVKDFCSIASCEKNYTLNSLISDKNKRHLLLSDAIRQVSAMLVSNPDLSLISNAVVEILKYDESWFDASWQKRTYESDDTVCLLRFVKWFMQMGFVAIQANQTATWVSDKPVYKTERSFTQTVHLIAEKDGAYTAFIINAGKPNHSPGGKSVLTNTSTQLEVLVAKSYLERSFEGIKICMIHLKSDLDEEGDMYPEFMISTSKKSNCLTAKFDEYEEDGSFNFELLSEKIREVVFAERQPNCFNCKNKSLCSVQRMQKTERRDKGDTVYRLPNYTPDQQRVIESTKGPSVVVAGPGSGKTATLVGRIKHLLDMGVGAERILCITYTKKASEELKERISSFAKELPYVSTINAFAFDVIRQNKRLFDRELNLMTPVAKLELIKNLLSAIPPIKGLKTGLMYGKTGLLKTVERKLDLYGSLGKEEFLKKERKLSEDFCMFAEMYQEAIRQNGYITYDEQVSLCIQLFKEHPDILSAYQNIFTYIMVDEFQDVNADNAELIFMLAKRDKNLCVVGDDDQAIYGFRGGDCHFMLRFRDYFPEAKTFVLSTNFRSTKEIVDLAESLVRNNTRIDKEITADRGIGMAPMEVAENSVDTLQELIGAALKKGYRYGDIAILSRKNAPLEELKETLNVPCVLAKAFLINQPFFKVVSDLLTLYFDGLDNDRAVLELALTLFTEEKELIQKSRELSLYDTIRGVMPDVREYSYYAGDGDGFGFKFLSSISHAFRIIEQTDEPSVLIKRLAETLSQDETEAYTALISLIDERGLKTVDSLHRHMQCMVLMEDDARVELAPTDEVLLITTHESKGKEFPVVIILDGESYENEEESRRLIYVAATRAKDMLFVCRDKNRSLQINAELTKAALA